MNGDRREFLAAGAAAAAVSLLPTAVHAKGDDVLKIGLVGCGGRGSGAVKDSLEAAQRTGIAAKLYAIGDVFEDKVRNQAKSYGNTFKDRVDLGDRVFSGLDNYQKVIDSGVDLVILATPPGFRPQHLEAAIKAKKHVFTEKPVAVDGPGIRKCFSLVEEAKRNNTAVVAGTQRRHQAGYLETVKQIQDGAIGDIVSARCAWNGQGIWFRQRQANQPDAAYQIHNWYHFVWICGDQIAEQHVHNLDVINWIMGAHPVKAMGFGARTLRPTGKPNDVGNIFDQFAIEYEYPNGQRLYSYCRHIAGSSTDISETVFGSKGQAQVNRYQINKERVFRGDEVNPYVQEHIDLLKSIQSGSPLNELQSVTESTMTAILGREAAYSAQVLSWDQVLNSKTETMPKDLTLESELPEVPAPVPGKYRLA